MIKIRQLSVLVFFSILFCISCDTPVSERKDFKAVMEVHDLAMADMGTMHNLSKELSKLVLDTTNQEFVNSVFAAKKRLEDADDGMMEWMQEFKVPDNGDEVTAYLRSEQVKVDKVSNDIYAAIENAKQLLNKK